MQKLAEPSAVLAVAEAMDKAVVVREDTEGGALRTAVVDCELAQMLALRDWISCDKQGRISRYRISGDGRVALGRMLAQNENRAQSSPAGLAQAPAGFDHAGVRGAIGGRGLRRSRYASVESPITVLARRRDKDGLPFLDADMVAAGERLREDFELARLSVPTPLGGDVFSPPAMASAVDPNTAAAQTRVPKALTALGPGLSDVTLRCCCHLEGLETVEKALGWSARSGKIVLRIALQQLARHYAGETAATGDMIG